MSVASKQHQLHMKYEERKMQVGVLDAFCFFMLMQTLYKHIMHRLDGAVAPAADARSQTAHARDEKCTLQNNIVYVHISEAGMASMAICS